MPFFGRMEGLNLTGLRERIHHTSSHESGDSYNPPRSNAHITGHEKSGPSPRRYVPFIASPLDPKTTEWLRTKHQASNLTLKRRPTVAQTEASRVAGGIFRKQHEASPLELFFDLFFVANLAVFTYNHTQTTGQSVGDYVGFFALIWSYWFHISIHDVRFYVDSILNRFFKLTQFVMYTSFTGLASVYAVIEEGGSTRAFHGLALVFMLSRFILVIQYAVVLWYVRPLKKTLVPLSLMILLYLCSGFAFLGTYYQGSDRFLQHAEGVRFVVPWYVIIGVEMLLAVTISSIWRILSFKRTHLVERIGLLTLIVMGEGIIGVMKSIAYVLDGTSLSIWAAAGRVVGSVFLIYLVFVLYFTPISHERFGTIRQQFWVLLHFPLHVAIVLTEEGSSATMLWSSIMLAHYRLIDDLPSLTNPSFGLTNLNAFVAKVNGTMTTTASLYTYLKLKDNYNWYPDLDRLKNISSPYGSEVWQEDAGEILYDMINKTTVYLFENFHFELAKNATYVEDPSEKIAIYYSSMTTIFTFFYTAAGSLLLVLAAMYWVGKNNKSWEEWVAITWRALLGIALPFISIAAWKQPWETGFMFVEAGWIVSVVTFVYLGVTMVDNFVQKIYDKRYLERVASGELDGGEAEDSHKRRYNGIFGPHEPTSLAQTLPTTEPHHISETKHESTDEKGVHFQSVPHRPAGSSEVNSSDSVGSGDATLSGRRESEQIHSNKPYASSHSQQQQQQNELSIPRKALHSENDWSTVQPAYRLPPKSHQTSKEGYGRIDTGYHGYDADADVDVDVDRHQQQQQQQHHNESERRRMLDVDLENGRGFGDEFRNHPSFEKERMIVSPVSAGAGVDGRKVR